MAAFWGMSWAMAVSLGVTYSLRSRLSKPTYGVDIQVAGSGTFNYVTVSGAGSGGLSNTMGFNLTRGQATPASDTPSRLRSRGTCSPWDRPLPGHAPRGIPHTARTSRPSQSQRLGAVAEGVAVGPGCDGLDVHPRGSGLHPRKHHTGDSGRLRGRRS